MKVLVLSCNPKGYNYPSDTINQLLLDHCIASESMNILPFVRRTKPKDTLTDKLANYIDKESFDTLIITHSYILNYLTRMQATVRTIGIIPYNDNPSSWKKKILDYYILPNQTCMNEFLNQGFMKDSLYPFGSPVPSSYEQCYTRQEAKDLLSLSYHVHLNAKQHYLLLFADGFPLQQIIRLIQLISSSFHWKQNIIVIHNHPITLQQKLNHYSDLLPNLLFMDATFNLSLIMDACYLCITPKAHHYIPLAIKKRLPVISLHKEFDHQDATFLLEQIHLLSTDESYRTKRIQDEQNDNPTNTNHKLITLIKSLRQPS